MLKSSIFYCYEASRNVSKQKSFNFFSPSHWIILNRFISIHLYIFIALSLTSVVEILFWGTIKCSFYAEYSSCCCFSELIYRSISIQCTRDIVEMLKLWEGISKNAILKRQKKSEKEERTGTRTGNLKYSCSTIILSTCRESIWNQRRDYKDLHEKYAWTRTWYCIYLSQYSEQSLASRVLAFILSGACMCAISYAIRTFSKKEKRQLNGC